MQDDFQEGNESFARGGVGDLPPLPRRGLVVLTCMDHRIDPARALGLELGDAMVLRNAGGRVTPDLIANLRILDLVVGKAGARLRDLELVLMQHTECGAGGLGGTDRDALANYLQVPAGELPDRSPGDPHQGIRIDIETLASSPEVPGTLGVTGLVYDTRSGRVELVERRSPLRTQA